jgi:hypothetical protein
MQVGSSESSSTFVRENAGALVTPLLCCPHSTVIKIDGLVLPPDALKGRTISNVRFSNCYFRPTSLEHSAMEGCHLVDCECEHLGLVKDTASVRDTMLTNTRVHALTVARDDDIADYYAPEEVAVVLTRAGFTFQGQQLKIAAEVPIEIEEDLRITEKALQTFYRSTLVAEGTFRLRLSINANHFIDSLLPKLVRSSILEEVRVAAASKYKLGVPLTVIAKALAECKGSFESFIRIAAAN